MKVALYLLVLVLVSICPVLCDRSSNDANKKITENGIIVKKGTVSISLEDYPKLIKEKMKLFSLSSTSEINDIKKQITLLSENYIKTYQKSLPSLWDKIFREPKIICYYFFEDDYHKINPICLIEADGLYEFLDKYPYNKNFGETDCSPFIVDEIGYWLLSQFTSAYAYDFEGSKKLVIEDIKTFPKSCLDGNYQPQINSKKFAKLKEGAYLVGNYDITPKFSIIDKSKLFSKFKNKEIIIARLAKELNDVSLRIEGKDKLYLYSFSVFKLMEKNNDYYVIATIIREDQTALFIMAKLLDNEAIKVVFKTQGISVPINLNKTTSSNEDDTQKELNYSEEVFLGLIDIDTEADTNDGRICEIVSAIWCKNAYMFKVYMYDITNETLVPYFVSRIEN